eukprot:35562_1
MGQCCEVDHENQTDDETDESAQSINKQEVDHENQTDDETDESIQSINKQECLSNMQHNNTDNSHREKQELIMKVLHPEVFIEKKIDPHLAAWLDHKVDLHFK